LEGVSRDVLKRYVDAEAEVLWTTLLAELPEEVNASLGPDSRRAANLKQAIIAMWSWALVFEMKRDIAGKTTDVVMRSTLGHRVNVMRTGKVQTREWLEVYQSFPAWVAFTDENSLPLLGFRATLSHQVRGQGLPGIQDDGQLLAIAGR